MKLHTSLPATLLTVCSAFTAMAGNIPQYRVTTDAAPYAPVDGTRIEWSYITSATVALHPEGFLDNPGVVEGFPIGFDLRFGGRWFNRFIVTSAGQLYLGEDEVEYCGTEAFTIGMSPVSQGVESAAISYLTEGETGQRVLTVQFAGVTVAEDSAPKGRYNMQIRLFEHDSHAEIAFQQLQAPYGDCPGFDVSLHGWDDEDALVVTAPDISAAPEISPESEADMLYPASYVHWNRLTPTEQQCLNYRFTPETSTIAPDAAPAALEAVQVGSDLHITARRAKDADATLILLSKEPITSADFPGDGETFRAAADSESAASFGDAQAIYYGPAEDINVTIPDVDDSQDYYLVALSANGYPAFNVDNPLLKQFRTTQAAPGSLFARCTGTESMEVTCRAAGKVILATTHEARKGFRKGYTGAFGQPSPDAVVGDVIEGGGTVVYVGEPGTFPLSVEPNRLTFLRAWTVADGTVSANSRDAHTIPEISLPFIPCLEAYPWGEPIQGGWDTGEDFAPWYRYYSDDFGVLGVTPGNYISINLATPPMPLDVPVQVSFGLAMETVRQFGEGNEPGWFGDNGYLKVKSEDGTIHKLIRSYDGEMVKTSGGYVDFSSTYVRHTVNIPSRSAGERIIWEFCTQKNTACFLRDISITQLAEEPGAPESAPTRLTADEDADGIINISCRRAEDAAYTLVLFSTDPMTDRELPVYGDPLEVGDMVGNATVLYFGTDEEVACSTAYIVRGNPEFIFADYDTDYYIRAISASENPIYNVNDVAELTYRSKPNPSAVESAAADNARVRIYTPDGVMLDTADPSTLLPGLYIIGGKKHIVK